MKAGEYYRYSFIYDELYEIYNPSDRIICITEDEDDARMIVAAMNRMFTSGA